jgi:hypothetical protein
MRASPVLPKRIPKQRSRSLRWRSPAHCTYIRGYCCCICGSQTNIAAAHVRLGSHTGVGQKPDDWRTVPLCDGPNANIDCQLGCHNRQHIVGEQTFWEDAKRDPEELIRALIEASPKKAEIRAIQRERGL